MTTTEACRQYQDALEHERTAREHWEGVLSAAEELDEAVRYREACWFRMEAVLLDDLFLHTSAIFPMEGLP